MASEKKLILVSSDFEEFVVEEAVVVQSETIKNLVEDDCASNKIPVPNVDGKTLAKVMEFCTKHANKAISEQDLKSFDAQFVAVDTDSLYDLLMAANYLNIKSMLDVVCQKVADMIKGQQPEEIRKIFNVKNDFTPEQEAEIRKENAWAF